MTTTQARGGDHDGAPPHDLAAERTVLGAVLRDGTTLNTVRALVAVGDFYHPAHALIFEAMGALHARGEPIDGVTLATELRQRERLHPVGGAQYLGELTAPVPPPAHVASHARIVAAHARARRMAAAAQAAAERLLRGASVESVAPALEAAVAREQRRTALLDVTEALAALDAGWARPQRGTTTGLRQLDQLLAGRLRAGDLVGLAGAAGGGKSALAGQVALDAAKAGATVVYASVEMSAAEVLARWLACEVFRAAAPDGREPALGYSDVLYDTPDHDEWLPRLDAARKGLAAAGPRLFVQQIDPGATVEDLRALVATARERTRGAGADPLVVLVVDPLQRLYASPRGGRTGRALDAVNAHETERVGAVAQELKFLADTDGLAVLFTSDTTKAAALTAQSSAGSLRGSYQLNHLATLVLGLHAAEDATALRARLDRRDDGPAVAADMTLERLHETVPAWVHDRSRDDAVRLGARIAVLECSKNRRGACRSVALGFVPGAACFVERADDPSPEPPPRGRGGRR